MITIAYTDLSETLSEDVFKYYLTLVPNEIRQRITSFRCWDDQCLSLVGKLLLKRLLEISNLSNYTLSDLKYNQYKRPYFCEEFDFNISHSGKYVICVISHEGKVGIDIEEVKKIPIDDCSIFFTEDEWNLLNTERQQLVNFYKLWTRKEAVLKAYGRGLHKNPKDVSVITDVVTIGAHQWRFKEVEISVGYVCNLAHQCEFNDNIELLRFPAANISDVKIFKT